MHLGAYHTMEMHVRFGNACKNRNAYTCINPSCVKTLVRLGACLRHGRVKRTSDFARIVVRIHAETHTDLHRPGKGGGQPWQRSTTKKTLLLKSKEGFFLTNHEFSVFVQVFYKNRIHLFRLI